MFRCPTKRVEQRGRWKPSRSPAATGSRRGPGKDYLSFSRIYEHNLFLRRSLNCTADLLILLLFVFRSPCRREWAVLEVCFTSRLDYQPGKMGHRPAGPQRSRGPESSEVTACQVVCANLIEFVCEYASLKHDISIRWLQPLFPSSIC